MESLVVESQKCLKFKSPLRILAGFFRRSRDRWKGKYFAIQAEIKRYKNQAGDARRSRERWRTKAELLEVQVQQLTADRDHWKQQAAEPKNHQL